MGGPFACVLLVVAVASAFVPTAARSETTAERLRRLRADITATRASADRIAARYERAYAESVRVDDEITRGGQQLRALQAEQARLVVIVRARASSLYIRGAADTLAPIPSPDVLAVGRAEVLMSAARERDTQVIDALRRTAQDVDLRQRALRDARGRLERTSSDARSQLTRVNEQLTRLGQLQQQLQRQLAEEQAQRRRADLARQRALAAARAEAIARAAAAATSTTRPRVDPTLPPTSAPGGTTVGPPTTVGGGGPVDPPPASGGMYGVSRCPIQGPVAFTDSWLAPRPGGQVHYGVDMLSPYGTPNVAVVSGTVEFRYGARQGNGIFLFGDNGTTYYYFHLASYAGSPRRVQAGEVIGYVGSTGQSGANHTHFEIHPGGGAAVNPYPAVRAVC